MKKHNNTRLKILVIDDEVSILDTMGIVLEVEGHEVLLHESPPTVEQIIDMNPDIIFLDLLLKGTNGKTVCNGLKANDKTKHIPIIMLSAYTKPLLVEAVQTCNADGYLTKPFDVDVLYATVKKYTHS